MSTLPAPTSAFPVRQRSCPLRAMARLLGLAAIGRDGESKGIEKGFFLAAITVVLTAGASWGAALLWQIGAAGKFTGVSILHVNAHGHAQVFGWMLLFVMGAGYRMFPRFWSATLAFPRLVPVVLLLMGAGLIMSLVGPVLPAGSATGIGLSLFGSGFEQGAILLFSIQMLFTFARGRSRLDPATAFIFGALGWALIMAEANAWYTWATLAAANRGEVIHIVSTYQPALRSVQLRGFGLFIILGVCLRVLHGLFGLPGVGRRRAWIAFGVLVTAVLLDSISFILMRRTGDHRFAAPMFLGWLLLPAGVLLIALPWKLWRPFPMPHRSNKFIRAAFAWLAVAMALLLLTPVFHTIAGVYFSHAYYGATRHALAVGFISMMIVGMASRIVPRLRGIDGPLLPPLTAVFVLLNLGCFIRVAVQPLTEFSQSLYPVVTASGLIELAALAIWAVEIVRTLRKPEAGGVPVAPAVRDVALHVLAP